MLTAIAPSYANIPNTFSEASGTTTKGEGEKGGSFIQIVR